MHVENQFVISCENIGRLCTHTRTYRAHTHAHAYKIMNAACLYHFFNEQILQSSCLETSSIVLLLQQNKNIKFKNNKIK